MTELYELDKMVRDMTGEIRRGLVHDLRTEDEGIDQINLSKQVKSNFESNLRLALELDYFN